MRNIENVIPLDVFFFFSQRIRRSLGAFVCITNGLLVSRYLREEFSPEVYARTRYINFIQSAKPSLSNVSLTEESLRRIPKKCKRVRGIDARTSGKVGTRYNRMLANNGYRSGRVNLSVNLSQHEVYSMRGPKVISQSVRTS